MPSVTHSVPNTQPRYSLVAGAWPGPITFLSLSSGTCNIERFVDQLSRSDEMQSMAWEGPWKHPRYITGSRSCFCYGSLSTWASRMPRRDPGLHIPPFWSHPSVRHDSTHHACWVVTSPSVPDVPNIKHTFTRRRCHSSGKLLAALGQGRFSYKQQ